MSRNKHLNHVEQWSVIPEFDNYNVSSFGRIMNKYTGRILSEQKRSGYYNVAITNNDGKRKHMLIHRLVAIAFLPNGENKKCVDHIDHNPENNHLSNLRWCSRSENQMNKSKQDNNTSGITGVHFDEESEKWIVRIQKRRKMYEIGRYKTLNQAKQARIKALKELFQEYANETELEELRE